ncbi:Six-hairpin glycosidase-like protein [Stenotrophomonas maltophilia]|uniref:MGH1-like glycoside hydrolase domain-containing protein n=1 Tax=Stenotrophomonas maltophilia TaxID=40324 RepID=UPI0015DDCA44|nr:Six-hairpin glycosidase-like protein [Stenotrophomonas maltophilia]MBA0282226.1 Six-hairpin glycosidase-like protein [Stenotrophomonas maltophilia]MBA0345469.1 Six-hairpin glycosidase-like protein [Stenotrophomonas maltophilia]MBA0357906.1 Six-hairpin glycosidase-like protein [Stenotrophomonas maltophilia]MBA0520660.1 Six-hairpin glycosidase-like protein [Stenotrophomonas maltophilia]
MLKIICLTAALGAALGSTAQAADLQFDGRHARAEAAANGSFVLHAPKGAVRIAAAPMRSQTGSVMFDALFALAQQDMDQDRVEAIRDPAFDEGRPVPCECFQTGERWPYVWTRDVSFAADLALARLDPQRTRQSLQFKLSAARDGQTPGLFVAQDTGSGGSWPISSDRVVWFLAARHLLDDPAFADQVWQALQGTLAQDRAMVFDAQMGLYRGETSFLDWREQTYPDWTGKDVRFIGDSYALSTNVLHYQALRLAERLAGRHGDTRVADYKAWADALAQQIDARFWREDTGQYMSYIGEAAHPVPYAKVDLLGLSLGILADVLPPERARRALAAYPMGPAGSPVVWPQEAQQPIYHNRAIWPFVSAYSLRAARQLDDAPRIAAEIRSLMQGAALAGSNMENYELVTQAVHVDDGALSGPVVNSERQLWSVAGYLSMVVEGVFGIQDDGRVQPKLPAVLVPELFGTQRSISLEVAGKRYVLERPQSVGDGLLVAGRTTTRGTTTTMQLVAAPAATGFTATTADANARAPATPVAPQALRKGAGWDVQVAAHHVLWQDGKAVAASNGVARISDDGLQHCLSLTYRQGALESLHSPTVCVGPQQLLKGEQHWQFTSANAGYVRLRLQYANPNGPINTGVTAAVKQLALQCPGQPLQRHTIALPHSVGVQDSTAATFAVRRGRCTVTLEEGFNMSALEHFAHYTGGKGGRDGVLNQAQVQALKVAPVAMEEGAR